jgi:hypothetical protein
LIARATLALIGRTSIKKLAAAPSDLSRTTLHNSPAVTVGPWGTTRAAGSGRAEAGDALIALSKAARAMTMATRRGTAFI